MNYERYHVKHMHIEYHHTSGSGRNVYRALPIYVGDDKTLHTGKWFYANGDYDLFAYNHNGDCVNGDWDIVIKVGKNGIYKLVSIEPHSEKEVA